MASEGDAVKKLKRENRKLREQLELKQSEIETLRSSLNDAKENCKTMEFIVKRLLEEVYMERVKVDFDSFKLCVDTRCVEFSTYDELLVALKAAKLFLSP
jgi:prefoldin subunit 5